MSSSSGDRIRACLIINPSAARENFDLSEPLAVLQTNGWEATPEPVR
jgi:hypothetical protein